MYVHVHVHVYTYMYMCITCLTSGYNLAQLWVTIQANTDDVIIVF